MLFKSSVFVSTGTSVRSPRERNMFLMKKCIYEIKVSEKKLIETRNQNHWLGHIKQYDTLLTSALVLAGKSVMPLRKMYSYH